MLVVTVRPGICSTSEANDIYSEDEDKGYYNYEIVPEEPEEDPLPEEAPPAPAPEMQPPPKYTYKELFNMHPDQFKAYDENVTKWAVMTRKEEDILRYLEAKDIARRRAVAFASVVQYTGQKNNQYSNDDVFPVALPGRMAAKRSQLADIDRVIASAKEEFAIIMFSQQGCSFCDAQSSILKFFESNYQWAIRKIDIQAYPNMAIEYGIEQTPSLIILQGDTGETMPIATGVVSMEELRSRVYRTIRIMRGEVKPEQYNTFDYEKGSGSDPLKYLEMEKENQ